MNEEPAVDPVSMISLSLSHYIMRELEWNYGFLCFLFVQVNFLSSFFFFSIVGTFLFLGGIVSRARFSEPCNLFRC